MYRDGGRQWEEGREGARARPWRPVRRSLALPALSGASIHSGPRGNCCPCPQTVDRGLREVVLE